MIIFDDIYGVLSLNAIRDLVEHEDPFSENPFMEWDDDLVQIPFKCYPQFSAQDGIVKQGLYRR